SVKALKQAYPKCCVVLGLRDILDAPEVTQRVWESEGAYDAVRRYYDRILIYGSKEMFNTCSTYSLPVLLTGTHYCGYVVKRDPVKRAKEVRQAAGIRKGHFIFVSAGGGGDGPEKESAGNSSQRTQCRANHTRQTACQPTPHRRALSREPFSGNAGRATAGGPQEE